MSHLNGPSLGHNPQADEEERLRVRATFNLRDHFGGTVPTPAPQSSPIVITKAQVIELARTYGFDLIATGPSVEGGRLQNLEEKHEALKSDHEGLKMRYARIVVMESDKTMLVDKLAIRNGELAAEVVALKSEIAALQNLNTEAPQSTAQENPNA